MSSENPRESCCGEEPWFVVSEATDRRISVERRFCKDHGTAFLATYWPKPPYLAPNDVSAKWRVFDVESTLYECGVPNIGCWVTLREAKSVRRLSFRTGPFEVWAINEELNRSECPRPLTHRATLNAIDALGASLTTVRIDDFVPNEHVFFAKLELLQTGQTILIDVRPSDAVAMALARNVAILIGTQVFDKLWAGT
jgi:hypothetical protein